MPVSRFIATPKRRMLVSLLVKERASHDKYVVALRVRSTTPRPVPPHVELLVAFTNTEDHELNTDDLTTAPS